MANLRYVSAYESGLTRKRWGRGFTYQDEQGKTIQDRAQREWIQSLAIPPAWTDVWICSHQNGHILATGRDEKGRKQYIYHPEWVEHQNQKKFDRLYEFGQALPRLRETVDQHLRKRTLSRERVLAAVVMLLQDTLIRVGNVEYAQRNDSYGLTTLEDEHVEVQGGKILFDFVGKAGKEHTLVLKDRRLALVVQRCQDIAGYELFQYYDEQGNARVVDSSDVNAYLQKVTQKDFTAKVFRTWGGSTRAIQYLAENGQSEAERNESGADDDAVRACVTYVADSLGNTVESARQYYIHPVVFEAYAGGGLQAIYAEEAQRSKQESTLTPEERTLMRLLELNNGQG